MKVLFSKTFIKMFKLIPVVACVIISGFFGFILSNQYLGLMSQKPTYLSLSQDILMFYAVLAFVLLVGMLIWIICSNSGSGLFASEIHEGTMRLLLSKKISRLELVIGKVGGMLVGSFVYLVISFATFLMVFIILSGVEKDILRMVLAATLAFINYGIILIFILGGLATFLSSCFKKKVPAILILVALAALIFGIIPFARIFLTNTGKYDTYHLYLFDINYHLSLIFNQFLMLVGDFNTMLGDLSMFGMFTNLYSYGVTDFDLGNHAVYTLNQSLNSGLITAVYLALASGLYVLSYRRMDKKDI